MYERPSGLEPGVSAELQAYAGMAGQHCENIHLARNILNGGELSPGMAARHDQPRHLSGCSRLLNMVPLPCGGLTKRPGFEHMGMAANPLPEAHARLVPFIFSAAESRMLEFYQSGSSCRLRVWLPDGAFHEPDIILPWDGSWLRDISFSQSADVLFCAHSAFPPAKICRHGDNDWTYETINWLPSIPAPQIAAIEAIGDIPAGENSRQTLSYVATAIDAETGAESLPTAAATIENVAPLSQTYYIQISITPQAGASEYRIYKKSAGVHGYIGRITDAGENTFEDRNLEPDTTDTPPNARNPFAAPGEYPSLVFLHQQRLGYAASSRRPLTVWMSQAGNYESMAASIPPDDDDAIEATLAAPQANRILWAQSDRNGLAIGTEGGEWLLIASDGSAISPKDLSFQPQTYHGSQPGLDVLRAGSSLLFMQRGGSVVRDISYSFQDARYNSSDLSLLARHILRDNPCRAWCWQPEPYGIVWCALADGTIAALTYLREHDVVGWHRHQTAGFVEDLASIPAPDGDWQVWATIIRDNVRRIERLAPFYEGSGTPHHTDGAAKATFSARCIPCMPEAQLQTGSTFCRIRKINAIKIRVINSEPFTARVSAQNHAPARPTPVPPRGAKFTTEADWNCPISGGWAEAPKIELIMDGPGPVTILGLIIAMEISPLAGGQR